MKFTRELANAILVRRVDSAGITIGEQTWSETIALTHQTIIDDWCQKQLDEIKESDFSALIEQQPDVILYGTGKRGALPPRELTFALARRGIGFEVMDTAAAARTFNVLAGEGRPVAAVLTPESADARGA